MTIALWFLFGFYLLYTLIRAFWIFNSGIKEALGIYEDVMLYQILWGIIDIPAMILGKLFYIFKFLFNVPVVPLKKKRK
jgi:hypothetical protein